MERIKENYRCGQDQLYAAINIVLKSAEEEIDSFIAFKSKYGMPLIENMRAELNVAISLPSWEQRLAEQEVARIKLLERLDSCLELLNALRLYIRDAYLNVDIRAVRLSEAGFDDYSLAANANWEKLSSVMNKGYVFIVGHEAELLTGGNMPIDFRTRFELIKVAVQPEILVMLNLRENNKQGTSSKVIANNNLYVKIMELCEDGVYIFRNNAAKRVQFVWKSVLELITPPGGAGLKGVVRENGTNLLIVNARVVLLPVGLPEIVSYTDEKGRYEFKNVAVGRYMCRIEKAGFVSLSISVRIGTGVRSTKNIVLVSTD